MIKLTQTAILRPAGRVSKGKVSLGINQLRGPQDHSKVNMKVHTMKTFVDIIGVILNLAPERKTYAHRLRVTECDGPLCQSRNSGLESSRAQPFLVRDDRAR
ncbi:hypothetical protein V6N13_148828 [Hibiscus sabdariffa]